MIEDLEKLCSQRVLDIAASRRRIQQMLRDLSAPRRAGASAALRGLGFTTIGGMGLLRGAHSR